MKKGSLIISIILLFISFCFLTCNTNLDEQRELHKSSVNVNGYEISTIEYDSCEYLVSGSGYTQMITHKGNCKYCIKRSLK